MSRRRKKEYVLDERARRAAKQPPERAPFDHAWEELLGRVNADASDAAGVPTVLGLLDAVLELAVARKSIASFGGRRVTFARRGRALRELEAAGITLGTMKLVTDLPVEMALRRFDRAIEQLEEIASKLPPRVVARAAKEARS